MLDESRPKLTNSTNTHTQVAAELKGTANVAKVDVPANRKLGQRFDIKGFPTLKFFSHGVLYSYSGPRDKDSLIAYAKVRGGGMGQPPSSREP